jgi:hypothetical protein
VKATKRSPFRAYLEDGTMWPRVGGEDIEELQWRLRYGDVDRVDKIIAADIIRAYRSLVYKTQRRRNEIASGLRAAEDLPEEDS